MGGESEACRGEHSDVGSAWRTATPRSRVPGKRLCPFLRLLPPALCESTPHLSLIARERHLNAVGLHFFPNVSLRIQSTTGSAITPEDSSFTLLKTLGMFPFSQEMRADQAALIPPAWGGGGDPPAGSVSRGPAAGGAQAWEWWGPLGRWTLNSPFLPVSPDFSQSLEFVPSCATHSGGHTVPRPSALGLEFPPRGCCCGRGARAWGVEGTLQPPKADPAHLPLSRDLGDLGGCS